MSSASRFLTGMAQAISAMNLYKEGHPALERAIDVAFENTRLFQAEAPKADFTFLGGEVVLNHRPQADLRNWDWGSRMAAAGVQRLEILGPVSRDELEAFLEEVRDRLAGSTSPSSVVREDRFTNIRFGLVGIRGGAATEASPVQMATATLDFSLREEAEAVRWLHEELQGQKDLKVVEAEAVVRSLSVAMHGDQNYLIPLLRLKEYDQYTTSHTLNVSVLSMALAEFIGLETTEVRLLGIAALLHDLGKVKVPDEILNKPGKLTDEERRIMNSHPVEGARILLATEKNLDLAAVVAYEHHIRIDGKGYPPLRFPRKCHQASDLVHVCDVFDALRTDRPYRPAWSQDRALGLIRENAGVEFEPRLAHAFLKMMETWESRVAEIGEEGQALPLWEATEGPSEDESGGEGGQAPSDPPEADLP